MFLTVELLTCLKWQARMNKLWRCPEEKSKTQAKVQEKEEKIGILGGVSECWAKKDTFEPFANNSHLDSWTSV